MRSSKQARQRSRAQLAAAVVGVDAGKFKHCLVVRPRGGADSKPFTFHTTREGFDLAAEKILTLSGGASPSEILIGIEFAGVYGFTFAYYLQQKGFQVVSVLASHSKRWKEVMHSQSIKTDEKDAGTITDLVAIGQFVSFPFLKKEYAEAPTDELYPTLCRYFRPLRTSPLDLKRGASPTKPERPSEQGCS